MNYLLDFLSSAWQWLTDAWSWFVAKIFLLAWIIAMAVYLVVEIANWCLDGMRSFFTTMADTFDSHFAGAATGGGSGIAVPEIPEFFWTGLKMLNGMFPVDTFAEMIGALIVLWTTAFIAMLVLRVSTLAQW
jgi:hypothetical protein